MKNDIFNIDRFGRYLTTDLKSFITRYWLSLLILSCSGFFVYLFKQFLRIIFLDGDFMGNGFYGNYNGAGSRVFIFLIFLAITSITAPKQCYGYITNKKDGTSFILLPASRLEKYISMLIISCIIVPIIFITIHLSIDALICLFDSHCGEPILSINLFDEIIKKNNGNIAFLEDGSQIDILKFDVIKPWMFIDDVLSIVLFFLLGALIFKRSKIAKTIGCYLIISMIFSSLFFLPYYLSNIEDILDLGNVQGDISPSILTENYLEKIAVLLRKIMRVDLISDSITNCCLLAGIWFRLKTIKH